MKDQVYNLEEKGYKYSRTINSDISPLVKDEIINEVGFLDTGNNLKDPFFNRPIILVNKELIKKKINTFLIPYYTVNNHSLLEVFKPNKIVINNKIIKNVLIGISDVNSKNYFK